MRAASRTNARGEPESALASGLVIERLCPVSVIAQLSHRAQRSPQHSHNHHSAASRTLHSIKIMIQIQLAYVAMAAVNLATDARLLSFVLARHRQADC